MDSRTTRAELKSRIFGKRCSRYRVPHIKVILARYGIYYASAALKNDLLKLLQDFEERATESEKSAVVAYFGGLELSNVIISRGIDGKFLPATARRNAISGRSISNQQPCGPASEISQSSSILENLGVLECNTCLESLSLDSFPTRRITSTCNHDAATCFNCLQHFITSQLADTQWNQLSCPSCPALLSFDDVRDFGGAESFERYDHFATLAAMREDANFRTCVNPACDSGQIHESGDEQPIMTCKKCGIKSCFTHGVEWHAEQTCADYGVAREARQQDEEQATETAMLELAKLCPNENCSVPLQKNGGCDHFTCRMCKHEFCWKCLASWKLIMKDGNTAHAEGCPHHTSNLPTLDLRDDGYIERFRLAWPVLPGWETNQRPRA